MRCNGNGIYNKMKNMAKLWGFPSPPRHNNLLLRIVKHVCQYYIIFLVFECHHCQTENQFSKWRSRVLTWSFVPTRRHLPPGWPAVVSGTCGTRQALATRQPGEKRQIVTIPDNKVTPITSINQLAVLMTLLKFIIRSFVFVRLFSQRKIAGSVEC